MKIKEIKEKMLAHTDFWGCDMMYRDEITNAKTKKELAAIMDKYRRHLENSAVDEGNSENETIDALTHHDNFKKELGLNY